MRSLRRLAGPLYGYRAWKRKDSGLYSLSGWRPWPEDRPHAALCWHNFLPIRTHAVPGPGHRCGLYAWREPPPKTCSPRGMTPVWGVVELTGRVAVHAAGYRAQFAHPVAIEYADGVEPIAERYGLVVLEDLSAWQAGSASQEAA